MRADAVTTDDLERERKAERDHLADILAAAAIRLRDAELAKQKAGKEYAEALRAFNEFVAPVPAAK